MSNGTSILVHNVWHRVDESGIGKSSYIVYINDMSLGFPDLSLYEPQLQEEQHKKEEEGCMFLKRCTKELQQQQEQRNIVILITLKGYCES